jgi:mercuric ion binding protein
MKKLIQLLTIIMLVSVSVDMKAQDDKKKVQKTTFECSVDCHSCEKKIMQSIPFEKGVKDVKVDIDKQEVVVSYKPTKNNDESLKKALEKLGYKVKIKTEKMKED